MIEFRIIVRPTMAARLRITTGSLRPSVADLQRANQPPPPRQGSTDRLAAVAALIALSPVLLVVAVAIRLDSPGSPFYLSPRVGKDGRPFRMIKFRTMVEDADCMGQGYCLEGCADPRITRVGRVLRAASLDELPQLFNVIKGDMSLVGPRPGLPGQVAQYDRAQMRRLEVRPGLTGLAQVSGRNNLSWEERIEKDVEYIDNWSPWLDLKIVLKTVGVVLRREGLYSTHQQKDFV